MGLLRHPAWSPEVRRGLEDMIQSNRSPAPIAAFDWDNTVIRGDVGEAALQRLGELAGEDFLSRYERLCHEQGKRVGYAWCAEMAYGRNDAALAALAAEVLDREIAAGRITYREPMVELVEALVDSGWQVWVVSASLEELVVEAARRIGWPRTQVLGMRLARDAAGVALPKALDPLPYEEGKVAVIDRFIGRRPRFAAGDSDTDLPMLEAAEHRLVIDRGQPALRRRAADGGYWLQAGWGAAALA
jgi:HAD superfamily phosphoserine phosphatase-like hydrolase